MRSRSGQALLETALAVPIILLIVMGIIAFGQIYNHWLVLNHAGREAARAGVAATSDADMIAIIQRETATLDQSYISWRITPAQAGRTVNGMLSVEVWYHDYVAMPIISVFANPKILYSNTEMKIYAIPA